MAAGVVAMEEEGAMVMEEGMAVREAMMTWVWGISMVEVGMEAEVAMEAVGMEVEAMVAA